MKQEITPDIQALYDEITELKKKHNAVILGHYYVRPEVQLAADYLGDSLGLSQIAGETDAEEIVFCGVHFMAETAKIISPEKKVLIPALNAGCTLADSVTAKELRAWKDKNPDGLVVSYVNTSAEVKAETDYCVTSANALKVVRALPEDRPILFGPDQNLGRYISLVTGREMEIWHGDCYVHRHITSERVREYMSKYPNAEIVIHPEAVAASDAELLDDPRCTIGSTTSMMNRPGESDAKQFIIATEPEVLAELTRRYPDRDFIPLIPEHRCEYMKLTTLEELRDALLYQRHEVNVPESIRERALLPIRRMLEF